MKKIFTLILFIPFVIFAQVSSEDAINLLLNNWHHSAAISDSKSFFDAMTPTAHYIGTDEKEDWTREEMRKWAEPAFAQKSAWDFTPKERHIYLYSDQKLAWFDETLLTWMGICRGSGVVIFTDKGWKIEQYVLSVAIPNEKIEDYLKIIGKKP